MRKYLSRAVAIATLLLVFFVLFNRFDIIKKNFLEHKFWFLLVALTYICGRFLDGIKLRMVLSHFGLNLKKYESFGICMMVPFYNLIFPNAGIVTSALYLKSKYELKFRHFISVGLIKFISTVVSCSLIGICASIIYMMRRGTFSLLLPLAIYVATLLTLLTLFLVPIPLSLKRFPLFLKLFNVLEGLQDLRSDKRLILSLIFLQTGVTSLFLFKYYIIFKALSLNAPFLSISAVMPMTALSNLVNLIPANLAIREAVVSGSSALIGYTLADGLLVAAIDRAVLLTIVLLIGSWFFIRLKYSDNLIAGRVFIEDPGRSSKDESGGIT